MYIFSLKLECISFIRIKLECSILNKLHSIKPHDYQLSFRFRISY